ncbi:MAG: helix-turn-helix transcriptional regulator, partial [Clostridium sp.]
MGKVNNALRMLAILRSRKKVTRSELAKELEVSTREVTRYKEDLEYAGVSIDTTCGKFGGYELMGNDYLLNLDLSASEVRTLENVTSDLKLSGNLFYSDMDSINNKIKVASKIKDEEVQETNYYSKGIKALANLEEEKHKWLIINEAIIGNKKVFIKYSDSKGNLTERTINPYGLFTYYGANFIACMCNTKNELRTFKLVRINEVKLLKNESFEKTNFNLKEYLDSGIGLFKDAEFNLKLKIDYPYAQGFKEFKWMAYEDVEDFKDAGYIIYKAKATSKTQTIDWIMGMGSNCEVLEPQDLRRDVIENIKNLMNKYSGK